MIRLGSLFPDSDFAFHLTLQKGEPREFFKQCDISGATLEERRRWLRDKPDRYAAMLPEGVPLLSEFVELCKEWGLVDLPIGSPQKTIHDVGAGLEPDVLFLSRDDVGEFRLRGGALCFPTAWALEEKIGLTLEAIHGVVPGLNGALGAPISRFLSRLKPPTSLIRENWGISASDELNRHPSRRLAAPAPPADLAHLYLRIEEQMFLALPNTGGVVFGIRIENHRLDQVTSDTAILKGLIRALVTMPHPIVVYKGLEPVHVHLIEKLKQQYRDIMQ
jgi:hypothetical protein